MSSDRGVTIIVCGVPDDFQGGEEPLLEFYTIIPEMEAELARHELELDQERAEELALEEHRLEDVVVPEIFPSAFLDWDALTQAEPWRTPE